MTACGPSVGDVGDGSNGSETTDATTTAPATSTTTSGPSTTTTTTSAATSIATDASSSGIDDNGDGCGGFYGSFCFDMGEPVAEECSLDDQDCPVGQKCMPWANDGGDVWNATTCTPVDPFPAQLGDPCQVEGSPVSGYDNCDIGLQCFGVDTATNTGYCAQICSIYEAQCDDAEATCMYPAQGLLGVCLSPCDPLAPQCAAHEGCYPYDEGVFGCAPDGSGAVGTYGDPCTWQTDCQAGSTCVLGMHVPACDGVEDMCCTDLCDPTAQNTCPDAMQGQACLQLSADPLAGACL
jgi:hypothetical protein